MLAAGGSHSCAIAADDTITCWGANPAGQADPPAGQYKAITAGFHHSCAIAADDTITCWGLNIYGRADAPTGQYKAIAAGGEHSCAIAIDDTITCWGLNDHGRADVPAALSMTPGKGVNVIAGRADWASGYFQAELYKLLLEELGYNVSDPAELEAGVSIAYLAMADSPLPLRKWVYAIYLDCTSLRGISAMSLHRSSGVCYKTAWFLQQRIREAFAAAGPKVPFEGPVEVDETYVGGKAKNMHAKKRRERITGRGGVDKTPVVGARDRATGHVAATVVENVDGPTLRGFVADHTADESTMVYTDGASAYRGRPNHEAVHHSIGEYVRGKAHTNGVENFWAALKRGIEASFFHISPKHCQRYVDEFCWRHNVRDKDTIRQMQDLVARMVGRRITWSQLTGPPPGQLELALEPW